MAMATPSSALDGAMVQPLVRARDLRSSGALDMRAARAGEAEHGEVVPVVADGEDVVGGDAAQVGEVLEGGGLGAAGGEDVEQGEVGFGVGGAVECYLGVWGFGWSPTGVTRGCWMSRASAWAMRSMGPQSIIWMGRFWPGWSASSRGSTWAM